MIDIGYLFAYEGGEIVPGDDAAGFAYRRWTLDELAADEVRVVVPHDQKWLFPRAVELHRLWRGTDHPLQPVPTQQIDVLQGSTPARDRGGSFGGRARLTILLESRAR